MTRSAAITYDGLPISSGGAHTLRVRGIAVGLKALESFVDAISIDRVPTNLAVEVVEGNGVPQEFTAALITEFDARYVRTHDRRIGDYTGHQWEIDPISMKRIVERLDNNGPIPQAGYAGPAAAVYATWNLRFFDPKTKQPLPYQEQSDYLGFDVDFRRYLGCSCMYSRISETTTANLFLSLPFEDATVEAKQLVEELQKHFPARLSSKHWKRWSLTKKGNSYVGRKIAGLI